MARGKKTDSQMIANIMTSYALTNSYNATAKELGISDTTVKSVIVKNKEEFGKVKEQKKELFQEKANKIIDKQLELLKRRIDMALDNEDILDELIDEAMTADDKEIKYQEKIAIAKRIGKLQLNSLSEITTSMGTLYDKMRLANGESTSNTSVNLTYEEAIKEVADDDEY